MRIELLIFLSLVLFLTVTVSSLPWGTLDHQVVYACKDLVVASVVHGVEANLPCTVSEGSLTYGDASVEVNGTSYSVVVKGEHWIDN